MIVSITELFFQRLQRSYGNRGFLGSDASRERTHARAAASGPFFSAPRNNVLLSRDFSRLHQMETLIARRLGQEPTVWNNGWNKKKEKKEKKKERRKGKERKEEKRKKNSIRLLRMEAGTANKINISICHESTKSYTNIAIKCIFQPICSWKVGRKNTRFETSETLSGHENVTYRSGTRLAFVANGKLTVLSQAF